MTISLLSERPDFADTVAHRGWHAWWTESGKPLADYRAHLDTMIEGQAVPFALVAHEGDAYRGSVLVIQNDLDARPQLSPWMAALWVEPAHRRQGHAGRLLDAAHVRAAALGYPTSYLCALPEMAPYYLARGFQRIERDVGGLDVFRI